MGIQLSPQWSSKHLPDRVKWIQMYKMHIKPIYMILITKINHSPIWLIWTNNKESYLPSRWKKIEKKKRNEKNLKINLLISRRSSSQTRNNEWVLEIQLLILKWLMSKLILMLRNQQQSVTTLENKSLRI